MKAVLQALILGAIVLASPLRAESTMPGIRFDLMPVGCRIHGVFADGSRIIEEYAGKRGTTHVVRGYRGPGGRKLVRTTTYDAEGYMIRKDWPDGRWETFTPFSCFTRPGDCAFTFRNDDGKVEIAEGTVTRRGDQIISRGGPKGKPQTSRTVTTLGPFGVIATTRSRDLDFRVTGYESCGPGLPSP